MDLLIVDDEKIIRDATLQIVEDADHYAEVAIDGRSALEAVRDGDFDAVLLDLNLGPDNGLDVLAEIQKKRPGLPVVVFTAAATISAAVEAMRRGALDFLEKPFTVEQLHLVLARVQRHRALAVKVAELQTEVAGHSPEPVFESADEAMTGALDVLFRAAPTPASILILGESGTGKSVVARAIHERSQRASKPFVTVNCPGLSKELLESELFGHVKGSFTGAIRDHWGKVKAAEGGTLFLDEIGELPLEIQPKLLRLLQDRQYERLGENTTRSSDLRIIAATNRGLAACVAEGTFREDLYYRLNVISVRMPSLRERPGDLGGMAEGYLRFFAKQCGRKISGFSSDAKKLIRTYPWPGNLRELRNAIERAVILCRENQIRAEDFPAGFANGGAALGRSAGEEGHHPEVGDPVTLDVLERAHIQAVIARTPSLAAAAETLGIDQATLYRKRKKFESEEE
ncbi:MAG: sigma-54-dependent Fis family transcriptional regulator [Verrucomicrobiales bacterium]|nr:sigma-54-dependent Fis family transcriptional regulator [Verrucomicrobiales bacterium]